MFEPRLSLVPELDGEFSLLSETDVPSHFFTARAVVLGAPKGIAVGNHVVAIRLPLKYTARGKHETPHVVHHRAFNLGLEEGLVVKAYLTLGEHVLGVSSVVVTGSRSSGVARHAAGTHGSTPLTQALCQAIVVEATPDPDEFTGPAQQLFQLGVVDAQRTRFHRLGIRKQLQQYGYTIELSDITSGPDVPVDVCRDSVFQHAG